MPTSRGWTAIGVAGALLALWIGFGERELLTVGLFLGAAVLVGIVFVRVASPAITIERRLHPETIHAGELVSVELLVSTRRRLRNVQIEDMVHGLGVARFAAAKTDRGQGLIARYEVSCRERGLYQVGPAAITVSDPFALTERRGVAGPVDRLVVYPRIEALQGVPAVRGHDPAVQSTRPTYAPSGGDDFYTLREYQVGDDLRKVHWPSTAKRGDLMIKQLEIPWQARALVLLDTRADRYPTPEDFEHAVRGAASAVTHLYRGGFSPALWTAHPTRGLHSDSRYRNAMDALAVARTRPRLDLLTMVSRLRRDGVGGGALVVVTGDPDDPLLAVYRALARDFTRTVVMAVTDPWNDEVAMLDRVGAILVVSTPQESWAPAWRGAMERSWATA